MAKLKLLEGMHHGRKGKKRHGGKRKSHRRHGRR